MSEEVRQFEWYLSFLSEYGAKAFCLVPSKESEKTILMLSKRYAVYYEFMIGLKTYKSKILNYFGLFYEDFIRKNDLKWVGRNGDKEAENEDELEDELDDDYSDGYDEDNDERCRIIEEKLSRLWNLMDTKDER